MKISTKKYGDKYTRCQYDWDFTPPSHKHWRKHFNRITNFKKLRSVIKLLFDEEI